MKMITILNDHVSGFGWIFLNVYVRTLYDIRLTCCYIPTDGAVVPSRALPEASRHPAGVQRPDHKDAKLRQSHHERRNFMQQHQVYTTHIVRGPRRRRSRTFVCRLHVRFDGTVRQSRKVVARSERKCHRHDDDPESSTPLRFDGTVHRDGKDGARSECECYSDGDERESSTPLLGRRAHVDPVTEHDVVPAEQHKDGVHHDNGHAMLAETSQQSRRYRLRRRR